MRPGDNRRDLLGNVFEEGYDTEHVAQQKAGGYIRFEARKSPGNVVVKVNSNATTAATNEASALPAALVTHSPTTMMTSTVSSGEMMHLGRVPG